LTTTIIEVRDPNRRRGGMVLAATLAMQIIVAFVATACVGCTTSSTEYNGTLSDTGVCSVPSQSTRVTTASLGTWDVLGGCLVEKSPNADNDYENNVVVVASSAAAYAAAIDATTCYAAANLAAISTIDFTTTELVLVDSVAGTPDFLAADATTLTLSLYYPYFEGGSARDILFVLSAPASPKPVGLAACNQICNGDCGPLPG
jgi:hypothetical protein